MISLKQFKYFVEIIEAGSYSRAAEKLYIAQSALSRKVTYLITHHFNALLVEPVFGAVDGVETVSSRNFLTVTATETDLSRFGSSTDALEMWENIRVMREELDRAAKQAPQQ